MPLKYSDTSTRVLETLKVLVKKDSSIQDVINHFEKLYPNNPIYTSEVILKYINTLKVFGYKFVKEKDKYVLLNPPSRFDFEEKELKTIYKLQKYVSEFPEENLKTEITKFLQGLEQRFSDETLVMAHNIKKPEFVSLKLDYQCSKTQIQKCENFCSDAQKLKITYKDLSGDEISVSVEPLELKYIGKDVYLSVYNALSAQIQDINLNHIIDIVQLPLKVNQNSILSSMTFRLKGRLAKAYKLHEGEKLLQVEEDGNIVVLNQTEDRTLLLKRLMRYSFNCEVISPKKLKSQMLEMIEETLKNY